MIQCISDNYNSWCSAIETVAKNGNNGDKEHSWICRSFRGHMCIVSHKEYLTEKNFFSWNRTYNKLALSELVNTVYEKLINERSELEKKFGELQLAKTETDKFKHDILLLKYDQKKLTTDSKKMSTILQGMRDRAQCSKSQKTGFFAWVIAKIWNRWFDPKEKLDKLQNQIKILETRDVATEVLKFRACINMQIIEKAVNGAEITKNVTSKADVKKWFVKHHSDKLTNHQKEHLAKDLEASAAHSRMTEFLKLWDLVCPDEPKAPAAQVGDSSLATDVDAEID